MNLNKIINFIAFQVIWLIAVIGAANEKLLPTVLAVAAFCCWQLSAKRRHQDDLPLLGFAIIAGLILDSAWQALGLIQYNLPIPMIAPIWIILLWITLALSINHSMIWLKKSIWLAILFGAIGAPMSYYAGSKLDALSYPQGLFTINILLAISWALVMIIFTQYERFFAYTKNKQ